MTPVQTLRAAAERVQELPQYADIAEPLAALLDELAERVEHWEAMYGDEDAHDRTDVHRWLGLARAILATAPSPEVTT